MRRLGLLVLLVMCAASGFARNESVSAISFNPSRLGAYTYLKVVNTATFAGGVDTKSNSAELNIQSSGTVKLHDANASDHLCANGKCSPVINNPTGNLNSIDSLGPTCSGTCTTGADMQGAVLKKASSSPADNGYDVNAENQPTDAQGTTIVFNGGTFRATRDSYIHEFELNDSLTKLSIVADNLTVNKPFHAKQTFTLGKIKVKSGYCSKDGCQGYKFVERLDTNKQQKYKVLAVRVAD